MKADKMIRSTRDLGRKNMLGLVSNKACLIALLLGVSNCASEAQVAWSKNDIAALFPPAMDGWTGEAVAVEPIEKPFNDLELLANALNENFDAGASIRLKAVRTYSSYDRVISITIDTSDIDNSVYIDALEAVFETDPEAKAEYEFNGISSLERDGYQGFKSVFSDMSGQVFRVGTAGVVSIECSDADCDIDLQAISGQLDLRAVAEFVAFDHRSPFAVE